MNVLRSYRLRLARRRWRLRALRKRRELTSVINRTGMIRKGDVLLFCTLRNERPRLPFFLRYYRSLGISHFFFVDNGSDDGSRQYLAQQEDTSVWYTEASYKRARFGIDWLNWLQRRHAHGHWTLAVDVDEFFVYPFCDTRPIRALTDWLDASSVRSFGAMLVDMYPKGPLNEAHCDEDQDPFEVACWFDSGNYVIQKNRLYGNLWIQGGPRARGFFADTPALSPALNKIPLVKWHRSYTYVSSTHMLLPRGLNFVYDEWGGEKASGCLLHAKFLNSFDAKSQEELERGEHYADSREYRAYQETAAEATNLWNKHSEKYINWRQLDILGLMSKGNWA
ncbi:MAG: glycosyltransferase family 2 protein [Paracoccaceae bacterium]